MPFSALVFNLPIDLLRSLFGQWISFKSLMGLEDALCNKELQEFVDQTVLRSLPITTYSVTSLGFRLCQKASVEHGFLKWATEKRVVVTEICVVGHRYPNVKNCVKFLDACGEHVKAIQFVAVNFNDVFCNPDVFTEVVVSKCPSLERVSFCDCCIDERGVRYLLKHAPIHSLSVFNTIIHSDISSSSVVESRVKLQKVSVVSGYGVTVGLLERLMAGNDDIVSLDILIGKVYEDDLFRILKGKKDLRRLCISDGEISDESVMAFVGQCPNLMDVEISGRTSQLSDVGIEYLVTKCKNLQLLRFGENENISDVGLRMIADHCPKLKSLDVFNCLNITLAGLRVIFEKCKLLCSLKFGLYMRTGFMLEPIDGESDEENVNNVGEPWPPIITAFDVIPILPTTVINIEIVDGSSDVYNASNAFVNLLVEHAAHVVNLNIACCNPLFDFSVHVNKTHFPKLRNVVHNLWKHEHYCDGVTYINCEQIMHVCKSTNRRVWLRTFDESNGEIACSATVDWRY